MNDEWWRFGRIRTLASGFVWHAGLGLERARVSGGGVVGLAVHPREASQTSGETEVTGRTNGGDLLRAAAVPRHSMVRSVTHNEQ